jgi:hypothetical protein
MRAQAALLLLLGLSCLQAPTRAQSPDLGCVGQAYRGDRQAVPGRLTRPLRRAGVPLEAQTLPKRARTRSAAGQAPSPERRDAALDRRSHATPAATRRWLLADDQGMVCKREDLDYATGCCKGGQRHSCNSCSEVDKCCSEYEQCVSCCMKPGATPNTLMERTFRGMNK